MLTEPQRITLTNNWEGPPRTFPDQHGRPYRETQPGQIVGQDGGRWEINTYIDVLTLTSPYIITEQEEPWQKP